VSMADFQLIPQATVIPIPGTILVSSDGLTATFTPNSPLSPSTGYFIEQNGGILDLEGQNTGFFFTGFQTGTQ